MRKKMIFGVLLIAMLLSFSSAFAALDREVVAEISRENYRYIIDQVNNHTDSKLQEGQDWAIRYRDDTTEYVNGMVSYYLRIALIGIAASLIIAYSVSVFFDATFIKRKEALFEQALKDFYSTKAYSEQELSKVNMSIEAQDFALRKLSADLDSLASSHHSGAFQAQESPMPEPGFSPQRTKKAGGKK